MSLSSQEIHEIIMPYLEILQDGVLAGFEEYNDQYRVQRHKLSSHARAIIIHDHIVNYLKVSLSGFEGVRCFKHQGLELISIEGRVFIRVKKMNKNMQTCNIPTNQSTYFSSQLSFNGFQQEITNINLGFIPNDVWTNPMRILITCPNGNTSNSWYFDITRKTSNTIDLDLSVDKQNKPMMKKRIQPKIKKSQIVS